MEFLNEIDMHRVGVIIWKIAFVVTIILSSVLIYEMKNSHPCPITKQNVKTENCLSYNYELNQDFQDYF